MGASSEVRELRTKQINDFMSQFEDLNSVDTQILENGLRNILGESPGVDFEYGVEHTLNETTGEDVRLKKLDKIHIYYSYISDDNKVNVSKISYLVD